MVCLCFFLFNVCGFSYILLYGADPYLNMDAGTMSPFEHGEVFVLDDGGEVFADIPLPSYYLLFL